MLNREAYAYYADGVDSTSVDERAALVALLRLRPAGLSWPQLTTAVRDYGSAVQALEELDPVELFQSEAQRQIREQALHDVRTWEKASFDLVTILDERYPATIRDIHQAPPFLFAAGRLLVSDPSVSVVGSRKASTLGIKMAGSIAAALIEDGLTVVSGLAAGIDATAHEAALSVGGRTVAVIGTGITRAYPAPNQALQERIASEGLLLSQFWPDSPPQRHTFLLRNATMSGYGMATVVVEAGEHSGARAQARMAVEHGRPVILTDMVVESTAWAKQLRGRPGVHVAHSVSDVMAVVRDLRAQPSSQQRALAGLFATG